MECDDYPYQPCNLVSMNGNLFMEGYGDFDKMVNNQFIKTQETDYNFNDLVITTDEYSVGYYTTDGTLLLYTYASIL